MKKDFALITASIGVALFLTASGAAAAQLYRCTTDDGRIVYSDRKCAPVGQRQVVKITDNSMDNSNLQSTAAIRTGLDSAMAAQGGGKVAVIGNSSPSASASSASSSSSSTTQSSRPARRRCGG
ncbi:MAG: DUF4124 domain-containing protein [Burkholderiales bacterium]|jgi:hypothetical protein|nr:DUF4124 domain-containing protein [Burkholderiales bacterium]